MDERLEGHDPVRPDGRDAPPIDTLPDAYAAVLRGLASGASDHDLADLAGIEPAALAAFLRVAVAKLLDVGDENA